MDEVKILKRKSKRIKAIKIEATGLLFMLPMLMSIALFTIYPIIQSLFFSFFHYNYIAIPSNMEFVGLQNYIDMFTINWAETWQSLSVTFLYTIIAIPFGLITGFSLGLIVNQKLKGIGIIRALFYLPCVIPPIASSILWLEIFDPNSGIFNQIIRALGGTGLMWMESKDSAMFTMFVMGLWGSGGGMVLWLATFKGIPETLYEAAKIDGANAFVRFWKITVPMSSTIIFFNLISGIIGGLQAFGSFLMTGDGRGPEDSLYFLGIRIYNEAFIRFNMGYASALAWLLFILVGFFSLLLFLTKKWVYVEDDGGKK